MTYAAPNHVCSLTDRLESFRDWNVVWATPISPGRSRIFVRVVFEVSRSDVGARGRGGNEGFHCDLPRFS